MSLGERLKVAREAKGWNRDQLQHLVGSKGGTITRWERNERSPNSEYATKLAVALGVNERWLVNGTGPMSGAAATSAEPVGPAALEKVLSDYEWGDAPIDVADSVVDAAREEALTHQGMIRPASSPCQSLTLDRI